MAAFEGLRKDASAGVDGVTYGEYEQDVWRNIPTLHHRLLSHQYRVQPLRRVYIRKENGKERPISIPALEDKIVQRPRSRCSTRSTSRTSAHAPTASVRVGVRTTRSMRFAARLVTA